MMNKLVDLNPYDPGEIIPDLANGWDNHEDAQGITLHFPENVQWHNGEAFTCEDARFSLETMVTGNGLTNPEMIAKLSFVEPTSLTCEDDLTLNVRFKGPSATALDAFTDRAAFVFNKAWFEAGGEVAMATDVSLGTGPFISTDRSDEEARFEKNPNYFKGDGALPYLDEVVIYGIVDESRQQASMLAHQGDWHWIRNFGQYDAYVDHDQIRTVIGPTRGHHSVWLKKANPPFDNVRVRQAIFMSIDREAAIQVLLDGHGSLGFLMPPSSPWALDESIGCQIPAWCPPANGDMEAQRAEAKQILEEEGFDFNKTFLFTVESDAQVQARATFIQEQLRLIGVKTDSNLVETVAWRQQSFDGSWGDILPRNDTMPSGDPAVGLGFYMRCSSVNNHWTPGTECDQKAEDLLDRLSSTVDPAERKAIADELQKYGMEQYWKFPLYWEQEGVAFWPEVRGYVHHPAPNTSFLHWEHMWIDPSHKDDSGFKGQTSGVPGGI
jgi:peptide/nickel transport system substrate-binding protein